MENPETLQELKAELIAEAATEIPRKRGRPKSKTVDPPIPQAPQQEMIDAISPEMVGEILSFGFEYLADRRGDHWKLSIQEKERIAVLASRVSNKYLPEWLAKFGDEIALTSLLGIAIFARMRIDAEIAKVKAYKPNGDTTAETIVTDLHPPTLE